MPVALALVASSAAAAVGDRDDDGVPDAADAFPCDGQRSAVSLYPSAGFGTLLYEDNWPSQGDLDFNDAVVAFHVAFFQQASGLVTGARLTVQPRAVGASIHSGLALRLPIPRGQVASVRRTVGAGAETVLGMRGTDGDLVVTVIDDLHALFGRAETWINTTGAPTGDGPVVQVDIELVSGVALAVGQDPVDLFFFRTADPGHEVHRSRFGGTSMMHTALFNTQSDASTAQAHYIDGSGLPFVIALPTLTTWPRELVSVDAVWPRIVTFAASGGASAADFYVDASTLDFEAGALTTVPDDGAADCAPRADGAACSVDADCASHICDAGVCQAGLPADWDEDGLTNLEETNYGIDGGDRDSDNDGMSDGVELAMGLEPWQFSPRPAASGTPLSACGPLTAGSYRLTQDLVSANGSCLTVQAQFAAVQIDCNGHSIRGGGVGYGVELNVHNYNAVIANCDISGFEQGIRAYVHNYDLTVERVHVHNNWGDGMFTGHHNYRTIVRDSRFSLNYGVGVNLTDWAQEAQVRGTVVRYNRGHGVTNDTWGQLATCGNDVRDNRGQCNYQTAALGCVTTPVLEAVCPPPPGTRRTVRIPLMVGGNYGPTGALGSLGASYLVGDYYGTEYRSWFAFDVSQELGTVQSAALVGGTTCSAGTGRPLSLYDVSTPVFVLAQNAGSTGFADLGSGTQLGGFDFTGGGFPATFSVPLDAAGIAALQGRVGGGDFRIGARYGMGAGLISPCTPSQPVELEITFQD